MFDRAVRSLTLVLSTLAAGTLLVGATRSLSSQSARSPLEGVTCSFEENRGHYPDAVRFLVRGDKTVFFADDGLTFSLQEGTRRWAVKLDFVGAKTSIPEGADRQPGIVSYFSGQASGWATGAATFGCIVYRDLWPGIHLEYATDRGGIKYRFIVSPGADPSSIRLRYRGVNGAVVTDEGSLHVTTPLGSLEDAAPVSWQDLSSGRVDVSTAFRVSDASGTDSTGGITFGFEVGRYDARRELVIDPAFLVYCGFLGGGTDDRVNGVAVDATGHLYVTGATNSTAATFPVSVGPHLAYSGPPARGPGLAFGDAFVAKLNRQGTALLYCGYIGGSALDEGMDIAVDANGAAYVVGYTMSSEATFPVAVGPDLTFNGGIAFFGDAFVAKVNPSGTRLDFCGYIGGENEDTGWGVALGPQGHVFVTGFAGSDEQTFPVVVGPDLTFNGPAGGVGDAFIAKVLPSGTGLVYCGYVGGRFPDAAWEVAVDAAGSAYIGGYTASSELTFPVRVGPDLTYNGGPLFPAAYDGFVAKVNASGASLDYCGFVGGTGLDSVRTVAVDAMGRLTIGGTTTSTELSFPVRVGPDLTYNGGSSVTGDGYIARVDPSGASLEYCGFLGGIALDEVTDLALDAAGNAYVTGTTQSDEASFPVVNGPDVTYNFGGDIFVVRVDSAGTGIDFSGYIGGGGQDEGMGIALDPSGGIYIGGRTSSQPTGPRALPVWLGPALVHSGGAFDGLVAKLSYAQLVATGSPRPGQTISLALHANGDAGLSYQVGTSLGLGPISVDTRSIGLAADSLLTVSITGLWPSVFSGYRGVLDARGRGSAQITIPPSTALIGQRVHTAFITLDTLARSAIRSISDTQSFVITP